MAFLSKKKNEAVPTITPSKITSATIITSCMEVTGTLQGSDTIHIDGKVFGDITVSNTLVIGQSGFVSGNVKAKNAIINGQLQGSIECDEIEVMQSGKVSETIDAIKAIIDGNIEGQLVAKESITVLDNGVLHVSLIKAKNITVHGNIQGKVVSTELLDIGAKGSVEGEIAVKNIKTAEGGRMVGSMSIYQETPAPTIEEVQELIKEDDAL